MAALRARLAAPDRPRANDGGNCRGAGHGAAAHVRRNRLGVLPARCRTTSLLVSQTDPRTTHRVCDPAEGRTRAIDRGWHVGSRTNHGRTRWSPTPVIGLVVRCRIGVYDEHCSLPGRVSWPFDANRGSVGFLEIGYAGTDGSIGSCVKCRAVGEIRR